MTNPYDDPSFAYGMGQPDTVGQLLDSYVASKITPPSFEGGAGIAESRPQTNVGIAPYENVFETQTPRSPEEDAVFSRAISNMLASISNQNPQALAGGYNEEQQYALEQGQAQAQQGIAATRPSPTLRELGLYPEEFGRPYETQRPDVFGDILKGTYNTYMTDIPVISPFMRETVRPAVGATGRALGESIEASPAGLGARAIGLDLGGIGQTAGEAFTPTSAGDIALSLLPAFYAGGRAIRAGGGVGQVLRQAGRGLAEGSVPFAPNAGNIDDVSRALPALDAGRLATRSVAQVPEYAPEAARLVGQAGETVLGSAPTRYVSNAPEGLRLAGAADNVGDTLADAGGAPRLPALVSEATPAPRIPSSAAPDTAKALDGVIPGESVADTVFRQYEGAVDTAARIERVNLAEGTARLADVGIPPGTGTPEIEQLYRALHGEGEVPVGLEDVFDDLKRLLSKEEALTLDFDPRFQLHPDYFPRFWQAPKPTRVSGAGLGAKPAFVKPRVDATFQELLDAGYKPKTWNPYEMVSLRRMAGTEYREQSKLLNILKEHDLVADVTGPIPDGWRIPDVTGAVFQPKPYTGADGAIHFTPPKMTPNPLANVMEQLYGRKINWGTVGKADIHGILSTVFNAPKRVKLLGSFFQQMDFATRTGFASMGGAVNDLVNGKPLSAIAKTAKLPVSIGELIAANLSPGRRLNLKRLLNSDVPILKSRPGVTWNLVSKQGLATGDVSAFNKTMRDSIAEGIDAGAGRLASARRKIDALNGAMERGLFEGIYPQAQKNAIENFIAPAIIRAHPEWTDAQIAASIGVEANKMFSSLPRSQSALRHVNRNITEITRMAIFSTNETESFIKATASTFHGPNKELWGEYWLGGLVFLTAVAEATHLAVTGEPLPSDRLSPVVEGGPLGITYNSRFLAPDIPLKGRGGTNLTLDLLGQMDTSLRMLDPMAFIKARENVTLRAIANQVAGKDFFGRPINSISERVGQFISDVGLPIPAQQLTGLALRAFPALEGWVADQEARLGIPGQVAQTTGVNLRAETNEMIRDRMASESGLKDKEGNAIFQWEQATAKQKNQMLTDPRNKGLAEELQRRLGESAESGSEGAQVALENQALRAEYETKASNVDTRLAAKEFSGQEARRTYDSLQRDLATERLESDFKDKKYKDMTDAEKAAFDYYSIFTEEGLEDPDTNEFQYDVYHQRLAEWEAKWPQYTKEEVAPTKPLSEGHAEMLAAREKVGETGFLDAYDTAYAKLKTASADFAKITEDYETLDAFRDAFKQKARNAGVTDEDQISDLLFKVENNLGFTKIVNIVQALVLDKNPQIVADLVKWYDLDPGELKILAELRKNPASLAGGTP